MTRGWSTTSDPFDPREAPPRTDPQRPGDRDRSHEYKDASRGQRLQKVLAESGVGSRRTCEQLIESGQVTVNGKVVMDLPAWVDPKRDRISVKGKSIRRLEKPVYVLLFKPRGVVSTNDDPEGRQRAIDLVKHPSRARLFPVGRLDKESSGLLLLTNDGEMANKLTHPRYGIHKTYEVTVSGRVDEDEVDKLERGIFLTDRRKGDSAARTAGSRLKIIKRDRDRTRLLLELREGRNRQVRRMLARLGHDVKKLRRVQMGPLKLKGLKPGQWRDLLPEEIKALGRAARLQHD